MSVRRCPGCHNEVEQASVICPVCGRTWSAIYLSRIARWGVILLIAGFIACERLHH